MDRNSEYEKLFTDEDKVTFFNKMAELFYDRNFGMVSKSVIELKMFSFYLDQIEKSGKQIDEYTLGKQLGLTESRVRLLKEKAYIQNQEEYVWQKEVIRYLGNPDCREEGRISFCVLNTIARKELIHWCEENKINVYQEMNPKMITVTVGGFIKLFINIYGTLNGKDAEDYVIEKINSSYKTQKNYMEKVTKESLATREDTEIVNVALEALHECCPKIYWPAKFFDVLLNNIMRKNSI